MGQEVYKLEAQLLDKRIVSSYVQDWERAVEILSDIKKQGHSQFFDYQIVEEVTMYQGSGENDWLELQGWQRPRQPQTTYYDNSGINPLPIVERFSSCFFNSSTDNPYEIFSHRQYRYQLGVWQFPGQQH